MGNDSNLYDIFISYRRKTGVNDARLLQQALKVRGYNVFLDFDSLRDGKFDERILLAIEKVKVFISMLTENSLDNCDKKDDWVRIEIEHAIKKGRKIILVQPSDQVFAFPKTLPDTLMAITTEQISELNKGALFEESVDRIIFDRFPSCLRKRRGDKILKTFATDNMPPWPRFEKSIINTDCLLGGRYRIVKQCGMGDMGTILLAEDTLLENKNVAIKIIPPELVENGRTFVEIKQCVKDIMINHPNIATCRSMEIGDNGEVFLVIDYVKGVSLKDYIYMKRRCLTEDEVLDLFTPIAEALDFMHSKGIVHGDIKPQTVMIADNNWPYVIDLGISRVMRRMITQVRGSAFNTAGTMSYQSPEVFGSGQMTSLSDVYSFSLLVYECLFGKHFKEHLAQRFAMSGELTNCNASGSDLGKSRILPSLLKGLSVDPHLRPATCRAVLGLDMESCSQKSIAKYQNSKIIKKQSKIILWIKRIFSLRPTLHIDEKKNKETYYTNQC